MSALCAADLRCLVVHEKRRLKTHIHIFRNNGRRLRLAVSNNVQQSHYIGSTSQILQYFYFSLDLLLFNGLQDLDNTLGVGGEMDGFKDLSTPFIQ